MTPVSPCRRSVLSLALTLPVLLAGCTSVGNRAEPSAAKARARTPRIAACPSAAPSARRGDLPNVALRCLSTPTTVELAAVRGIPVLVNLWASWCVPCQREMPLLQAAHEATGARMLFLGVDTADERASALDFLASVGVTYPQLTDPSGTTRAALGTQGIPVTVVADASGRVTYRHVGALTATQLRQALAAVGVAVPASALVTAQQS